MIEVKMHQVNTLKVKAVHHFPARAECHEFWRVEVEACNEQGSELILDLFFNHNPNIAPGTIIGD